jgi:hypothetical protein
MVSVGGGAAGKSDEFRFRSAATPTWQSTDLIFFAVIVWAWTIAPSLLTQCSGSGRQERRKLYYAVSSIDEWQISGRRAIWQNTTERNEPGVE